MKGRLVKYFKLKFKEEFKVRRNLFKKVILEYFEEIKLFIQFIVCLADRAIDFKNTWSIKYFFFVEKVVKTNIECN